MKVLLWTRSDCFKSKGGDMVQVENTYLALRKMGVDVDISDQNNVDISKYDLVHLFQLDWTPETYLHAKKALKSKKKIILSPIHHNINEVKKFDDEYVFGLRRLSRFLILDQFQRDTLKNIYRSLFDKSKIIPTLYSIFLGLKKMNQATIKMSDYVLTQTKLEAQDLKEAYGLDFKWEVIPNGVSQKFLTTPKGKNLLGDENYILCVGRIEPRKNNLNIIYAVNLLRKELNKDIKLVFVGRKSNKHLEYTKLFDYEVKKNNWITYLDYVSYDQIPLIYKYSKVCISASWFETTGLTLLEALFLGSNAVSSSPRAKEILGDLISYCEPDDEVSIKEALKIEFFKNRPELPKSYRLEYTWDNVAKKTYEIYKRALND